MADFVIKEDGSKEDFDLEKVKSSIRGAAKEAGIKQKRIKELVDQVSSIVFQKAGEKKAIKTKEIRDKILKELDIVEPSVAKAWREYEKENE